MSTNDRHFLEISGIRVEVVRKDIRNLHLGVYPPDGRVRVAVPPHIQDESVRLAVLAKLGWIRRQQRNFGEQSRQSQREMVGGESHYVQGRRYRLDVVEHDGPPFVRFAAGRKLELRVRPGTGRDKREAVLNEWRRQLLKERIPALVARWSPKIGVQVAEWGVRRMKTKWGSCNAKARRIWLNLELAKKPAACLEYVVVHEMVHLRERSHGEKFRRLMDEMLPGWRQLRARLNRSELGHEKWRDT